MAGSYQWHGTDAEGGGYNVWIDDRDAGFIPQAGLVNDGMDFPVRQGAAGYEALNPSSGSWEPAYRYKRPSGGADMFLPLSIARRVLPPSAIDPSSPNSALLRDAIGGTAWDDLKDFATRFVLPVVIGAAAGASLNTAVAADGLPSVSQFSAAIDAQDAAWGAYASANVPVTGSAFSAALDAQDAAWGASASSNAAAAALPAPSFVNIGSAIDAQDAAWGSYASAHAPMVLPLVSSIASGVSGAVKAIGATLLKPLLNAVAAPAVAADSMTMNGQAAGGAWVKPALIVAGVVGAAALAGYAFKN